MSYLSQTLRKLPPIALISTVCFVQTVWACEKPQVTGYDYVDCLSEGLAGVIKDNKVSFIDNTGKAVIPLQYHDARPFNEGLAPVQKKW